MRRCASLLLVEKSKSRKSAQTIQYTWGSPSIVHFRNNCVTFVNNFKLYSPLAAMSDPELAELKLSSLEVLSSESLVVQICKIAFVRPRLPRRGRGNRHIREHQKCFKNLLCTCFSRLENLCCEALARRK
jgi:hypothetical protein